MTVSLCMIVKDEEEVLPRCLGGAAEMVDEIVIVDTGSTDQTLRIARRYTRNIYTVPWENDFSKARNFAFGKATGEYLLWLDADDVITEENAALFSALKARLRAEQPDVVFCPYETGEILYVRERVLKNCPNALWRGRVHECIVPFGKVINDPFTVIHKRSDKPRTGRNLEIYRNWSREETLSGRDAYYYGRELFEEGFYPEAELWLKRCLAGDAWAVNKIEACRTLAALCMRQGRREDALRVLFESFLFGEPRASVLCEIGALLKAEQRTREAIYWYEGALSCRDHSAEGDFELPACRGITPALELVVLYYALGDRERAFAYHRRAEALAPEHPSVIHNRAFFKTH